MENNNFTVSVILTMCLLGSSASAYVFGLLTNRKETIDLRNKMGEWIKYPENYENDRKKYTINRYKPLKQKG
jgi:hypothetical protein